MKRYHAGDPLPVGHVCRCYHCAADRFPPERAEMHDVREAVLDGHFKAGWFPVIIEVCIDGQRHLGVHEFQLGKEPWAVVASDPCYHRCQTCLSEESGGRHCLTLIFPKDIAFTVNDPQQWEAVKARNSTPEAIAEWERIKDL